MRSRPSNIARPSNWALGPRVSPISVIAVTDFPDPDSPTIGQDLAGVDPERHAVDRLYDAVLGTERDLQILHLEQAAVRGRASGTVRAHRRIRGSRYA